MIDLSWMAWTTETAIFFATIFGLIALMGVWEYARPGGGPRMGILRFETTRGDRLFLSLLLAAFVHLAWLYFFGDDQPLWGATIVSVAIAAGVFTLV